MSHRSRHLLCVAAFFAAITPAAASELRINDTVNVGTAESYKQRLSPMLTTLVSMGSAKDAKKLDFEMPSIREQLNSGARLLSFDVAYDPKGGHLKDPAGATMSGDFLPDAFNAQMSKPGFKTVHVMDIDYRSNCQPLAACLKEIRNWSEKNPNHVPILISLTTNDTKTPMPKATDPMKIDAKALSVLDTEVRAALGPRLLTPASVQGKHSSLRDAVRAGAWPRLSDARGRIMVLLNDAPHKTALYKGNSMFKAVPENAPAAAILSIENPVKNAARISAAVKAGFIVMTRADSETAEARANNTARRQAAFASGAQYVATNFLKADKKFGSYQVQAQSACNRLRAPCTNVAALESPETRVVKSEPSPQLLPVAVQAPSNGLQPQQVRLEPQTSALRQW